MARRRSRGARGMMANTYVFRSRSPLFTVDTDAGGFSSWNTPLNPANLFWLNDIGKGFERYRFREAYIEYVPYAGTNTDGRVMSGFLTDPRSADTWQGLTSAEKIAVLERSANTMSTQVSAPKTMRIPSPALNQWKYCVSERHATDDATERQEETGHMIFAAAGCPASRTALGCFFLRYVVEFTDPVLSLV